MLVKMKTIKITSTVAQCTVSWCLLREYTF